MKTIVVILIIVLIVFVVIIIQLYDTQSKQTKKIDTLLKKNRQLTSKNISLEANRLKFILQPHTLNNILAQLKVFSNKLNRGMDFLSDNLEYIFYKGENHFVSLEDEIEFIKNYLALNGLFIRGIDAITIDDSRVDKNSNYYHIECFPHLITAYFLENAFKHGDTNHTDFLKVYLTLERDRFELTVINQIKVASYHKKSGVGLENMKSRLNLLMNGKFEIVQRCNENEYHSTLIINF